LLDPHVPPLTARQLAQLYGFAQPWHVRFHWLSFLLTLLVLLVLAVVVGWRLYDFDELKDRLALVPGALAIAGAWSAYTQWRAARRETSLEKFYDRLKSTNDQLARFPCAIAMQWRYELDENWCLKKVDEAQWQKEMYVFTEIDNLEYAVEKYWIGFMSRESATRAAHTFLVRCTVPDFRVTALNIVNSRREHKIGDYTERALQAAEKICAEAEKRNLLRSGNSQG
jgi:hypothetical protein